MDISLKRRLIKPGPLILFSLIEVTIMTITKADLINSIFEHCGLQKQESVLIMESLLEIIKHTLESGEDVLVSGFGKFCVKNKNSRKGRNPQTGKDAMLRRRRVVTFKHSGVLRKEMNG
jgi:integration host factor subunit alpha